MRRPEKYCVPMSGVRVTEQRAVGSWGGGGGVVAISQGGREEFAGRKVEADLSWESSSQKLADCVPLSSLDITFSGVNSCGEG